MIWRLIKALGSLVWTLFVFALLIYVFVVFS